MNSSFQNPQICLEKEITQNLQKKHIISKPESTYSANFYKRRTFTCLMFLISLLQIVVFFKSWVKNASDALHNMIK